ncbi:MAG: hypothetical protein L0Z49_12380, partial [Actinobacteria bacterium]|nr:hypothetical protein [Actinomycetota bacterium]
IQEVGVSSTARSKLNFGPGFDVADDAGNDQTDVTLDLSEIAAGGELGGTLDAPTVDATHSGSTHSAATDTHIADGTDAHDASAISVLDSAAQITATEVEGALAEIVDTAQAHEAAADPHTGYRLESADHTHQSTGLQAGTLDHGLALTGLTDDDHTQYRLESADHTHESTGLQAGTLDHGLALTGLTDDDHTQYRLESADHNHQSSGLQAGTLDHGLALTGLTDDDHTQYRLESADFHHVTFSKEGTLTTGTGAIRWYNDHGSTITLQSARGSVGTQPTGASILIDINNNGTSVWNSTQANRITIAVSTNTDEGGAFDDSSVADGEYITVDIDQVGSTVAGADLSVTIWYTF